MSNYESFEEIQEENKRKVKAFVAQRNKSENLQQEKSENKNLKLEKTKKAKPTNVGRKMGINSVRTNREITKGIIDGLIAKKHCPLITNRFICEDLRGHDLKKGKMPQCHCPDFINCPGFNQYTSHEVRTDRRKIGESMTQEAQK
ncbi:MAG: hypothetical protein PHP62_00460 [Candidatus Moranbacteria bacterium]|nr:hypothetical protein [Candidatus Moranbacteria bacterium]